ncbi:hypothetical protein ACFFOM_18045 [Microlunatus capsulatus]|uniref:Uncharacterized protein n=1 Tax=Microlunatus capsulatus TaxID=99117 RepID=A0ABS4ZCW4_9ACTN|nr:hypothetical protein [Microlunatus capsulatus]MBP2418908.1 hypothetical protein [Microlunatus capsulatus]
MVQDLIAPWRRHLPLLTGHGNWGSQAGDPPAGWDYTEISLSPYGELAIAAENGLLGPVPLGLVDGSWYRGGLQPPYLPQAMLGALRDRDPVNLAPAPPTGGRVSGDLNGLAAGRLVQVTLSSTVHTERMQQKPMRPPPAPSSTEGGWHLSTGPHPDPGGDRVIITETPYGVAINDLVNELAGRTQPHDGESSMPRRYLSGEPHLALRPAAPVIDVRDESDRSGVRVLALLRPDADPEEAHAWLLAATSARRTLDALLPAPLATLIASWDAGDSTGLKALTALVT